MAVVDASRADLDIDITALMSSLARDWKRIALVALCVTAAAFAFASLSTKHYQAETRILIETRESIFTRPDARNDDSTILDEQGVTSQVEVIGSADLLKQVARDLNLAALPEFKASGEVSFAGRMMILLGLKSDPVEMPPEDRVIKAFREKLTVYRVERSRVIVVQFSSEDPALAARVPNSIADAYIALQRGAKEQSNADATDWLEPEIADLSAKVRAAESRVADFRSSSDLMVGNNNAALATQQLSELSSELSRVKASRAASEATASAVRRAIAGGTSIDALPGVLASPLIQRLRETQVQLRADIADLSATLLDNHPRIRALRSQLADLDAQIRNEAGKVLAGLDTEADAARLREVELVAELNRFKAESARVGEQEVELRALEREAAAQRDLLESYLIRYREAASRKDRNYLPADARVFSRASVPAEPYFPKVVPITAAAFVASLLVMALVTLLRELFSGRALRPAATREPVRDVRMPAFAPAGVGASLDAYANDPGDEPAPVFTKGQITVEAAAERLIARGASRAIFVSPEGDEGAATAIMVAREVADAGLRTLLLDLTSTGAASRPMLDDTSHKGITNLLCSEAQFTDIIHADLYSDCHVIPVGTADPARAMRGVDRLPIIMNSLTTAYDLVIVECGPAEPASLKRLVSGATEVIISVIEEEDAAVSATEDSLKSVGYDQAFLVTPVGYVPPRSPAPSERSVA
ncbi:chain-length determining protein [Aquibium carbonis]|uniref:Chain-length determining protein n=1 Tax=Aquibium carbonis TaxID=2495581 RepID=A0A3S0AUE4_9HYPH|nr:Wzz/FepE/Etk N-terminal domain-containing protein [Aquibium carbonis]RST87331.1 chain-length determining protein [Aquibium carbonis]